MKKTLEYLLEKAGTAARKVKKAIGLAPLIAAASLPLYSNPASADVIFSVETGNSNGFTTRNFANNSNRSIQVNVYAESTDTNGIKELKWTLVPPSDPAITLATIISTNNNGWINLTNGISGAQVDFFNQYQMSSKTNSTGSKTGPNSLSPADRAVATSIGPKGTRGLVGAYIFNMTTNTSLGNKCFRVTGTEAYLTNGSLEPSSGSAMHIEVVLNYNSLTNSVNVLMDQTTLPNTSKLGPTLFVDTRMNDKKFILESSSDLKHWTPLATNTTYSSSVNMWLPYSFRDNSSTNSPARYYRARSQ